jgi:hypothetical protein
VIIAHTIWQLLAIMTKINHKANIVNVSNSARQKYDEMVTYGHKQRYKTRNTLENCNFLNPEI